MNEIFQCNKVDPRHSEIVMSYGPRIQLPMDCKVVDAKSSIDGNLCLFLIYQNDVLNSLSSNYFGILSASRKHEQTFHFHIPKTELNAIFAGDVIVWSIQSICSDFAAEFEVGQRTKTGLTETCEYKIEKWQLFPSITGKRL